MHLWLCALCLPVSLSASIYLYFAKSLSTISLVPASSNQSLHTFYTTMSFDLPPATYITSQPNLPCPCRPTTKHILPHQQQYYFCCRGRVGHGAPWGNKPPLYYVSFTCLWSVSGGRIQCCHLLTTLTEKQTLAKNALSKYFAFNALLHVWCNSCAFVMFYYSNKINHNLVQVLLYLFVVYRASFTFNENGW